MSNMDMLLQAAEFLECGTGGKTRAENGSSLQGSTKATGRERTRTISNSSTGSQKSGDEGKSQRRPGGAGTREVHNKLEKNRRAHLKTCFEQLKGVIPNLDDRKSSNLSILRLAIRHIQYLKRKEKEYELETQKLARDKIVAQERIATLRRELAQMGMEVDLSALVKDEEDSHSDSTATADGEEPIVSDSEEDGSSATKKAQIAAEQAAAKIMPPPPTPPVSLHKGPVISSAANKMHQIAPKGDATLGSKQMTSLIQLAAKPNVVVASPVNKSPGSIAMSPRGTKLNLITSSLPSPGATGQQPSFVLGNTMLNKSASNTSGGSVVLSVSQSGSSAVQPTGIAAQKPAVAQMLQQQIQQRAIRQQLQQFQQIQQQQQQQQPPPKIQNGQPQVIALQGNNNLKPIAQLPRGLTINNMVPAIVPGGTSILADAAQQANIPTTPTTPTTPVSVQQATTLTALNKLISSSVASNVNPVSLTTAAANVRSAVGEQSQQHLVLGSGTTTATALPVNANSVVPAAVTTSPATTVGQTNLKPITQIPIQLISPQAVAQMATLQQLVNQAVNLPRGNAPVTVTGSNPAAGTASVPASPLASPTVTQIPAIHPSLNMTPVLSPLILSPSVLSPSSLNQAQLAQVSTGNIVSSPLLKTISQIPVIQQPVTLSPAGIVKPIIMVTMPSVVGSTTAAQTATIAAPGTAISNSSQ